MKKFYKRAKHKAKTTAVEAKTKGEAYVEAKRLENEPPKQVPKITQSDIPQHREEVLSSARKFIYPLQHSKHKIVLITVSIIIAALIAFFSYSVVALYRLDSTSNFMYKVTQIIPFPIARVGNDFVAYENYLFELKRYMHYYETQQNLDFDSESGQQQLAEFQNRALDRVVSMVYIKDYAKANNIKVSSQEVDEQIKLLQEQNRLGTGNQVLEDVLQDYYGWSMADFKRYLGEEMLRQKVTAALDPQTQDRANAAYAELQAGTPFEEVAKKYSDDLSTKENGGQFGTITTANQDIAPIVTETLFSLQPGQYSPVVNIGYSLEIIKLLEKTGDQAKGAHIEFKFKSIDEYINNMKEQQPPRVYISLPPPPEITV